MSSKISIVIPALNEEAGIAETIKAIPFSYLKERGYETEVLVIDNGSTDNTPEVAKSLGARVIYEGTLGYGYGLMTGFLNAEGDIIVTADADNTYPMHEIPKLVDWMQYNKLQFLTTDRFGLLNDGMSRRNQFGNKVLTYVMNALYGLDVCDSQSGMWLLRKDIVKTLKIKRRDWVISQEIKLEAIYFNRYKWQQVPIEYHKRIGETKLKWTVGLVDLLYLFIKRVKR